MPGNHAEREHALLSASSAKMWLTCPPCARLSEQFPDEQTTYTLEGTLAHEISELKLRKAFIEPMGQRAFNNCLKKFKENPLFQTEMLHHTDTYLDYVSGIIHSFNSPPYVAVEKRVDYSTYAPEGFGTCDCLIISGNTLYVNDFKYGKGVPVSAKDNPQMKLYALGAYTEFSILYPIDTIKMAIIQPRLDSITEDSISVEELLAWGESIKPIALQAFNGEGEFVVGDHCKFCKARPVCRAYAEHMLQLEEHEFKKPPLLSNDDIGEILERAKHLASWVKSIQDYALSECLKGNEVAGWKAVEGRGSRDYTDLDKAFEWLKTNGIDDAVLYERKPLTVAAIEKVLGKADYRKLLEEPGLVKTEAGKPTLAPADDKRQAVTNKVTAAEAFGA